MRELTWDECDAVSGAISWAEFTRNAMMIGSAIGSVGGVLCVAGNVALTELFTAANAAAIARGAATGTIIGAAGGVAFTAGYFLGTGIYNLFDVNILNGIEFVMTGGGYC